MQTFLKIENPGVAPSEAFTLLGASTKRGNTSDLIGKFGSGNKLGVTTLLRANLPPVVFCDMLRLNFGTRSQLVNSGLGECEFNRIFVKYQGKDEEGKSRSSTEDLGWVLEYGAEDWDDVAFAPREFISNAIDRVVEEDEHAYLRRYIEKNPWQNTDEYKQSIRQVLEEYRKTATPWDRVVVDIVNENQVRAKSGTTRVFIPMNSDIFEFYHALGKWFLHFSEPQNLRRTILPKANHTNSRNLGSSGVAVIYRRGVRVREIESTDVPSLFDYNLPNLRLDESRKVDDYTVRQAAGRALAGAEVTELRQLVASYLTPGKYWEHGFDSYALAPTWQDNEAEAARRRENWQEAFRGIAGEEAVIAAEGTGTVAQAKGFKVITAPEEFVKSAERYGVPTPATVLTNDEREGREVFDATPDALAALDFVWSLVAEHGMTNGKARPGVKCFRKIMSAGAQTLGFYRDNTTFINADIAGYASTEAGATALSQQLLVTMLEEVAHHVTGATDCSRDFQDYCLNLAVKIAKSKAGLL